MRTRTRVAILAGMRNRLLVPLVLTALAAGLMAVPAGTAAIKLPPGVKAPKVARYPITIDVVGYLDYSWTWDSTKACTPGFAKTVEESLTFEYGRPAAGTAQISDGKVIVFPLPGGQSNVQTELSGWRTTDYCPPNTPSPKVPEPTCKKNLRSKIRVGVSPVKDERGPDDLAPLSNQTQVLISRMKPSPQSLRCVEKRPPIVAEGEAEKGWVADPYTGIVAPLGASDWDFWRLAVGKTLKRTVTIGGGCGRASFKPGAGASAIPPEIRSCVVKGKAVVMIKRTGEGFSTR